MADTLVQDTTCAGRIPKTRKRTGKCLKGTSITRIWDSHIGRFFVCVQTDRTPTRSFRETSLTGLSKSNPELSIAAIRSATSRTKERFCSQMIQVTPFEQLLIISCFIRSIFSCCTPSEGSSNSKTFPPKIIVRTKPNNFLSPPDIDPATWSILCGNTGKAFRANS